MWRIKEILEDDQFVERSEGKRRKWVVR